MIQAEAAKLNRLRYRYYSTIQEAKKLQANLIVLGSSGDNAIYKTLMGSVSESVLTQATCPVLLIPSKLSLSN